MGYSYAPLKHEATLSRLKTAEELVHTPLLNETKTGRALCCEVCLHPLTSIMISSAVELDMVLALLIDNYINNLPLIRATKTR